MVSVVTLGTRVLTRRNVSRAQSGGRGSACLRGGVGDGIVCAMAHGVGILLWALLMANGLGVLLTEQPTWFDAVQLAGAGFLLYLGIRVLMSQSSAAVPVEECLVLA